MSEKVNFSIFLAKKKQATRETPHCVSLATIQAIVLRSPLILHQSAENCQQDAAVFVVAHVDRAVEAGDGLELKC